MRDRSGICLEQFSKGLSFSIGCDNGMVVWVPLLACPAVQG